MFEFLKDFNGKTVIELKVIPKASKTAISGTIEGRLKLLINAVPEKGKANSEIIKFFSKFMKIPKSNIEIIFGKTSYRKSILLDISFNSSSEIFKKFFENLN